MTPAAAEVLSACLLAAIVVTAITRPRWLPEAAVAVPAAAVVIGVGALRLSGVVAETERLGPAIGFLAAVLVLGQLCESEGLFTAAGAGLARLSRHNPVRLLGGTFGLAAATTAVLSLDTTVVLLTPVVHETATRLRLKPKPHVYACTHLANSASLLLPVSNLTNLLAYTVAGLTLVRFTETTALPWVAAIAVEYAAFRLFFAGDLVAPPCAAATLPTAPLGAAGSRADMPDSPTPTGERTPAEEPTSTEGPTPAEEPPTEEEAAATSAAATSPEAGPGVSTADAAAPEVTALGVDVSDPGSGAPDSRVPLPRSGVPEPRPSADLDTDEPTRVPLIPLLVVALALAGFVVTSFIGVSPAYAAVGGAVVLTARGLVRRSTSPATVLRAVSIPFLLFVLCLGLVVRALDANGLGTALAHLLPFGSSLPALLAVAGIAAVFANLVNNLPAVLVLLAAVPSAGAVTGHASTAGTVLAILVGVNVGPNLSYAGSLATLLWRRLLAERDHDIQLGEFTRLGLLTVPAGIALATVALWTSLRLTGLGLSTDLRGISSTRRGSSDWKARCPVVRATLTPALAVVALLVVGPLLVALLPSGRERTDPLRGFG